MPACISCIKLDKNRHVCEAAHIKPLRNCIAPIVEEYHALFFPGCSVLEIGCGAWSPSKNYCEKNQMRWEGVDVLEYYMGKKTIATKIASVSDLPYAENYFDFVLGNQSLEHWDENHVPLRKGLSEVFRVLKPGGLALFNVPIHFHGDFLFVEGNLELIKSKFSPFSTDIVMEPWLKPSYPLPEINHLRNVFRHRPPLMKSNAYILDIRAKKMTGKVPYFNDQPPSTFSRLVSGLRKKGVQYYLFLLSQKARLYGKRYFKS